MEYVTSVPNTVTALPVDSMTSSTSTEKLVDTTPSTVAKESSYTVNIPLTPLTQPPSEGSGDLEGSGYTLADSLTIGSTIPYEGSGDRTTESSEDPTTRNIRSTTLIESTTILTTTTEEPTTKKPDSIIIKALNGTSKEEPDLEFYDIVFSKESSEEDANNTVLIPLENIKWNFSEEMKKNESDVLNVTSVVIDGVKEQIQNSTDETPVANSSNVSFDTTSVSTTLSTMETFNTSLSFFIYLIYKFKFNIIFKTNNSK